MSTNKNGGLQVCLRCGNMFLYSGIGKCICEECKKEDELEFKTVKEYIYNNPSATIMDTSQETGVRVTRIKSYLKDGRLVIPDESVIFLNCEVCGESIKFGRVCRQCADSLSKELKNSMSINEFNVGDKPRANSEHRMRFLNRN
ncbi:MAG: hypothetical protein ACK5JH_15440 [Anaerocolumna sp.]